MSLLIKRLVQPQVDVAETKAGMPNAASKDEAFAWNFNIPSEAIQNPEHSFMAIFRKECRKNGIDFPTAWAIIQQRCQNARTAQAKQFFAEQDKAQRNIT